MNCLNIGLGCLLILFNLSIYHRSYPMSSEICDNHTIYGHEMLADFFDAIDFSKYPFFGTKQVEQSNNEKKKSSADSENKKKCCIELLRKIFSEDKNTLQQVYIEMINPVSHSSLDCIENTNTKK